MNGTFVKIIEKKSDKRLKNIILNPQNYQKDFLDTAYIEFNKRGLELTQEDKNIINHKEQELRESGNDNENFKSFCLSTKENITKDSSAPELFSKNHIIIFSVLFSFLFGGILIGYNLLKLKKLKEFVWVSVSCLVFTVITIGLLILIITSENIHINGGYSAAGAVSFPVLFINSIWWNFIGKDLKFRKKSIVYPLIAAILTISIILYYFFVWK